MISTHVSCPSLSAFFRSLPAGSLVGSSASSASLSLDAFLAARPAFVASWAVRVLWSPCGTIAAFAFCAGPRCFGVYVVVLPSLSAAA